MNYILPEKDRNDLIEFLAQLGTYKQMLPPISMLSNLRPLETVNNDNPAE